MAGQEVTVGDRDAWTRSRSGDVAHQRILLRLLGTFDLVVQGRSVPVGASCQRLLALLSLKEEPINRIRAAGLLWPEVSASRANANLRSVLWRLQKYSCGVVDASFCDLRLASNVEVDVRAVSATALQLLDRSKSLDSATLKHALQCNFYEDILPDLGEEEWLEVERERYRQLRLHSLEVLSEELIAAGWYGAAIEAAFGAIRADPFRESAYQLIVRANLAEGNQREARRQYATYRRLLKTELGLEPTDRLTSLVK